MIRIVFISLASLIIFLPIKARNERHVESNILIVHPGKAPRAETWRVTELTFTSKINSANTGADKVLMDVCFVHRRTGTTLVRPAFWDGDNLFRVRFAPTLKGQWDWHAQCRQDAALDGLSGSFQCRAYRGDLPIYRHGFVQARLGMKYMTYADGKPFFYLGDTHWNMYREEMDEPGPHAGQTGTDSHVRYIVDRRIEQGFTVYQSEPIDAPFDLRDGRVNQQDIEGFRQADRYYQYIADRGLVHANAEFFFSSNMTASLSRDDDALSCMARYWVARFGAYPVMWTLAQEVDNDFYAERSTNPPYDWKDNPWVRVAEYIHRVDCYAHPLSAHQENAVHTSVTGKGVEFEAVHADGGGASVFASDVVAWRTGHSFWAAQWSPGLTKSPRPDMILDYWLTNRTAVNYEGRYCGLWTKDFGSRAQGWISFLSGFRGYGYGAIDIWLYQSTYDIDHPTHDGVEEVSVEDKLRPWCESIEYESAHQMAHLRRFLERTEWWNLIPVLPCDSAFRSLSPAYVYARTTRTHMLYFYARSRETGIILNLRPFARFSLVWFNPRTGEQEAPLRLSADADGSLVLPLKPDEEDWAVEIVHS